ncbi:MAG: EamA family transporter [Phascolarctobacterium sp.]|nr:EamA family transporter [Phascolarctobacterium sp.]
MKTRSYLYIIAAAVLWGLIGIFVKSIAAQGFSSMQIVALRAIASASCITLVLLWQGIEKLKIALRDLWMFVGTGICSLVFFNFCYFNCIQASSLAVAALLLYTAPIFVMLMSLVLFGEHFTVKKGIALVCTFGGCACVTGALDGGLSLTFSGLLYGLGSGLGYALYSIFGKYAVQKYSSLTITAYTFYIALLAAVPMAGFDAASLAQLNLATIGGALGLGLICAVIPYLLYTLGLEQVEPGQASILATIEPFVAAGVGMLFFAEPMTLTKALGMLLIFGSIVILNLPYKQQSA